MSQNSLVGVKFIAPGAAKNAYEVKTVYSLRGQSMVVLQRIKDKKIIELTLKSIENMQRNHTLVAP